MLLVRKALKELWVLMVFQAHKELPVSRVSLVYKDYKVPKERKAPKVLLA